MSWNYCCGCSSAHHHCSQCACVKNSLSCKNCRKGNDCRNPFNSNETGSRSPCMRPRSDPPKMKNSTPDKIVAEKKNNEANWMVSNSAKLDHRTKQHTQFGVSASNGSRDMARTKSWQKKIQITKRIGW